MKTSIQWLKEFVDIPLSTEALATQFNLMSAEVESLRPMVEATRLVIGHVETCLPHPDSDHLHVCTVDVGGGQILPIVCGAPNVEAGQTVVVALEGAVLPGNLKIKRSKIRGVESQGMICSLDELGIERKYHSEDGIHVLSEAVKPGTDALKALGFDDVVLDLDLTPNRGDLMSVLGIAFDVSAMLETELRLPDPHVEENAEPNLIRVSSETPACMSYYARIIRNVRIGESPMWMKARLIAAGIRPINNVVDITNYVMLEYGQPLHAFDFDKLGTSTIVVREARSGETITTLDGKVRVLTNEDLVITDGTRPVALAGVMGGQETEIDNKTTNLLLESATFDPIRIRKTANRLDLRSESSMRFERRIDPNRTRLALDRAAMLFRHLAGGTVLNGVSYFENNSLIPRHITLSVEQINHVTGYEYKMADLTAVFDRLHFTYLVSGGQLIVDAPTRRPDIVTYQDLIEEVVRIHGFAVIPTTLPRFISHGFLTPFQRFRRQLRNTLVDLGLDETYTYSLVTESQATEFSAPGTPSVRVAKPMVEDRSVLRRSLLPSMLEVAAYNISRKADRVALFEIGKGYAIEGETEWVSGVFCGNYQDVLWQGKSEPFDFFVVKGLLQALFERLGIHEIRYEAQKEGPRLLHPGISARLLCGEVIQGILGKLHPQAQAERNLLDTFVFELNLEHLYRCSSRNEKMREIAKYPFVTRDIAVLVDQKVTAQSILDVVRKTGKKTLTDVRVFDLYQGDKIPAGKKSLALSLTFQDFSKTLETSEIDHFTGKIVKALENELQAVQRG